MTKFTLAAALLLTLSAPALAGGAGAPPATGSNAQVQAPTLASVAAALREAGYKVSVNPAEPDRDPSMTVTTGDHEIDVWLSNCQQDRCSRVTASASWEYDEADLDLELVNDWNSNYYTQAYVYENAYYLDGTLPLAGGYTKATLNAWFKAFLNDVDEFSAELP